jgi:hypothetical protein
VPAALAVAAGYVQAAQGSGKEALQYTSWAADLVLRADMAMDAVCEAASSRPAEVAAAAEEAAAAAKPKLQQHRTEATSLADAASAAATAAEQHTSKVRTLAQQYEQGAGQGDVAVQLWKQAATADEAAVWARQQAQVTAVLAQVVHAVVSQLLALSADGGCLVLLQSTHTALTKAGHAAPAAAAAAVAAIRAQMEAKAATLVESEKAWPITGMAPLDGPGIVRMSCSTQPSPTLHAAASHWQLCSRHSGSWRSRAAPPSSSRKLWGGGSKASQSASCSLWQLLTGGGMLQLLVGRAVSQLLVSGAMRQILREHFRTTPNRPCWRVVQGEFCAVQVEGVHMVQGACGCEMQGWLDPQAP